MLTSAERIAVKDAVKHFSTVANSDIEAILAAAEKAVPGIDPLDVAELLEELAAEAATEAGAVDAELARRGIKR